LTGHYQGDWEDATRFNLDHVVPRSACGATNIRNLVWSCQPCNQRKGDRPVRQFLRENPERLNRVLRKRPVPLAAAGQYAAICRALVRRLEDSGLETSETTGADTAHARSAAGIVKSHANDAACCGSSGEVDTLRTATTLKAVGHGRRKQIKSLPIGPYLTWRHRKPATRRATPCPGHARHPNHVHRIRTGDTIRILTPDGWKKGEAQVEAGRGRVHVQSSTTRRSTSKATNVRRIAPANGYRESN